MPTWNEEYRDAALRHQIGLRRYSLGLVRRVNKVLERADAEMSVKLRERLARFEPGAVDFTGERWQALLADMREARSVAIAEIRELTRPELAELGVAEGEAEHRILTASVPIEVSFAAVSADQLRSIASSRPFQGKLLREWYNGLEATDRDRLRAALQLGMSQGESIDSIVRRVVGTKAEKYTDGILAITRRDAQTIVRTAVNHVSNTAREYVWEANEDVIQCRVWTSTLDGRTSATCRARDGCAAPVGGNELPPGLKPLSPPSARPPAHMNCRSCMVAYIDGVGLLGNRPTVRDTRTRGEREVDFRKIAAETGKDIKDVRRDWAARNVGRVPAPTTYNEFLKRQDASFQDAVLGKAKGALFRRGGLTVQDFVDRRGTELTLEQLRKLRPEAFIKAGLDD